MFKVRLKRGQSHTGPHGKLTKSRPAKLPEGSPALVYYRKKSNLFEVTEVGARRKNVSSASRRRRLVEGQKAAEPKAPEAAPSEEKPVEEAPADESSEELAEESPEEEEEDSVLGAMRGFTMSELRGMRKADLRKVAEDEFGLSDLPETATKNVILEAILEQAGEGDE